MEGHQLPESNPHKIMNPAEKRPSGWHMNRQHIAGWAEGDVGVPDTPGAVQEELLQDQLHALHALHPVDVERVAVVVPQDGVAVHLGQEVHRGGRPPGMAGGLAPEIWGQGALHTAPPRAIFPPLSYLAIDPH